MREYISVRGANEHNLKNIDVDIPRNKLVVITGLSGSGKSSLAFDTIYAEGQRRYVESLSAYARQFLGQMEKPDVEHIEGLSPAIAIDQKTTSRNPRSTVGTVTEIYDYLRLLYARVGTPHCPQCGKEITQQTVDQMVDQILDLPESSRILLLAPVVRGRKGEYTKQLDSYHKKGYARVRIDGEVVELGEPIKLERNIKHDIEVVVDRLIIRPDMQKRLTDSIETALKLSEGLVMVQVIDGEQITFSTNYACEDCHISIEEVSPRSFSFNSPYGACPECTGLGHIMSVDPALIVPDKNKSLLEGAINVPGYGVKGDSWFLSTLKALSLKFKFDLSLPYKKLPKRIRDILMYGSKKRFEVKYEQTYGSGTYMTTFEGLVNTVKRRHAQTQSGGMKKLYERLMTTMPCHVCGGKRLRPEILAVTIGDIPISDVTEMSIVEANDFMVGLSFSEKQLIIAEQILKEIHERLGFLANVGLGYLTLSRGAGTLSGGEAQRIRLATQIGSRLMGVLYILDEPSIGLHQRDNRKLLDTLIGLRDLGNTLLVVEHDEETIRSADHVIDLGPGPGVHGGEIVAEGTATELMTIEESITGQYLSGNQSIAIPEKRRKLSDKYVTIKGAKQNNLKNITASIPIGVMTCITGVSGSGKSSLINEILYKSLAHQLNRAHTRPGLHKTIEGVEYLDKVIDIDQSPIGRTPRSNPATYTGMFGIIRELFANTTDSKMRGYKPGRFSFNVKGGRCEACQGDGIIKIEMHFLPDVYVPCEICKGQRYSRETLDVRYKGKNIYEVLDMTVEEALEFFAPIPRIKRKVQTLYDVGLGYIKLGQPSTQLSGGEAQRIKLATELSKRSTGKTLYILDEPTTGLHSADVKRLVGILHKLTDAGNTVVIIEHNLDVIKIADYIIDMGPEGGDRGGKIIAKGRPESVAKSKVSYTGQYLKKLL